MSETVPTTDRQPAVNLKAIASRAGDLPTMPATSVRALRMTKDPHVSARDLQEVISQDQALVARVLRIVNSALYCLSREVSTISHAVALLGISTLESIILAATVQNVLRSGFRRGTDLGSKLLAEHSWAAAVAARLLAQRTRYENPEEAFLAGLMHDLGKPVMLANIDEPYTVILNDVYRGVATFHESEMREFGFSHQHVGALVAEKWKFPPRLCEAIGHHHTPLSAPGHSRLASIIALANQMMVALEIGFEKNRQLELEKQPAAEFLNLGKETLEEIACEVRSTLAQMPDLMNY